MTGSTLEDKKKTMEKLFNSKYDLMYSAVNDGPVDIPIIFVYQLSDFSVKVTVSDYLDPDALFLHLDNYGAYLKLLHSDEIWGDLFRSSSVTDRLATYIEKHQRDTKHETN